MKELTATVTTGPWARSQAGMLPAMSTWDMTQPPKMVPCALVSAGIGTMRRTGCSSAGSMVLMARFYRWALLLVAMAGAPAIAQTKTYALVAAMGSRFEVVYEVESTGSHLPPFRRSAYAVGQNMLNRLALQGLDQAIVRIEPESRRLFLSTDPGSKGIEHVISELRRMDRAGWDRIL